MARKRPFQRNASRYGDVGVALLVGRACLDVRGNFVRDLTDEVITVTTARAGELFDELVDTLVKEDDPIGVACSLLVQLTRFVAEAGMLW